MSQIMLSPTERLIIANQLRILSKLDEEYARYNDLASKIKILEQGFEGAYGQVLGGFAEQTLSAEDMRFTNEVLLMMSRILDHEDQLHDYDLDDVKSVGFDGNNEYECLAYAEFLFNDKSNNFTGIESVVNSHRTTRHWYESMLKVFREELDNGKFDPESAKKVLDAGHLRRS